MENSEKVVPADFVSWTQDQKKTYFAQKVDKFIDDGIVAIEENLNALLSFQQLANILQNPENPEIVDSITPALRDCLNAIESIPDRN